MGLEAVKDKSRLRQEMIVRLAEKYHTTPTFIEARSLEITNASQWMNQDDVLDAMRRLIAGTGADLVFLQEIHGRKTPGKREPGAWPEQPHFEYMADSVWPHHAYGRNAIYREGDHGNAILSKFPFAFWENINIAVFPRSSRSILHGVVEVPGSDRPLHLLCVHLGLLERERRGQLRVLSERMASRIPADEPLILAGDFND